MLRTTRDWVLAHALTAILAAIAVTGFLVQTVRIDGFRVSLPLIGAVGPLGLKADNDALRAAVAQLEDEKAAAARLKAQTEAANTRATEKANTNVERNLEKERAGADAFIARGGVRPCAARAFPSEDRGTIFDEGADTLPELDDVPVVTVLPEDVRICTENTIKARAWREWGLTIEANHEVTE
jgi:hypothetical protein